MIENILIEGIDRAGKTTLAKELRNALGWDGLFLGHRQDRDQYQRYQRAYDYCQQTVIERGHISEAVYSELFSREDPFTKAEIMQLNEGLATTLVIYASPELERALERYQEKTLKQTISRDDIKNGLLAFQDWFDNYSYPFCLSYSSHDFEEMAEVVKQAQGMVKQ